MDVLYKFSSQNSLEYWFPCRKPGREQEWGTVRVGGKVKGDYQALQYSGQMGLDSSEAFWGAMKNAPQRGGLSFHLLCYILPLSLDYCLYRSSLKLCLRVLWSPEFQSRGDCSNSGTIGILVQDCGLARSISFPAPRPKSFRALGADSITSLPSRKL